LDSCQAAILDLWFREVPPRDGFGDGSHLDPVMRERFGTRKGDSVIAFALLRS